MKRKAFILLTAVLMLLTGGCRNTPAGETSYAPDESKQLTVYVSHKEPVYLPIVREFEERTGIWVNVVSGGTNELLGRIQSEVEDPAADIMFGGGVESLSACRDCFTPYVSAEAGHILPKYSDDSSCWTSFSALPVVLIYNPKLVASEDLSGWRSLLSPQFQGKIAFADPRVSGSSFTALITWIKALDSEAGSSMDAIVQALERTTLKDSGQVASSVSQGQFPVGITLEESALKAKAAGKHIEIVYPEDGTSCLPDGIALVKGCPHPENAKLFLNFAVSRDAQQILVSQNSRRSVRTDIEDTLPGLSAFPTLEYDVDQVCKYRQQIMARWEQLMEAES